MLGMHDIASYTGGGSIFHLSQEIRCNGTHACRIRFERVCDHVGLDRKDMEGS